MADLNMQVLRNFTLKEVIGVLPPVDSTLRQKLETESHTLSKQLDSKTKPELEKILSYQIKVKQEMTKFSGAMALDQPKIELFHEFVSKYINEIEKKLDKIKH